MKLKISKLLLAVIGFGAFFAKAALVTDEEAGWAACGWGLYNRNAFGELGEVVSVTPERDADDRILWYVVVLEKGAAIVAPDTEIEPVIAVMPGSDGNIPEKHPLRAMLLRDLKLRLATLPPQPMKLASVVTNATTISENARKWATLKSRGRGLKMLDRNGNPAVIIRWLDGWNSPNKVGDVQTLRFWNQQGSSDYFTNPQVFNRHTPEHYACGCVATAGSAIMHYFRVPEGNQITRSCSTGPEATPVQLTTAGGTYDWSLIDNLDLVNGRRVTLSNDALNLLARVAFDCGIGCGMAYNIDGQGSSGSNTIRLMESFRDVFNVANVQMVTSHGGDFGGGNASSDIGAANYAKIIYNQIRGGAPVAMGIDGHEVVATGYGIDANGADYTYVFLGWGSQNDAWYALPTIDTKATVEGGWYTSTFVDEVLTEIAPFDNKYVPLVGRLVDEVGDPVPDATITVSDGQTVTTDANGYWGTRVAPESGYYDDPKGERHEFVVGDGARQTTRSSIRAMFLAASLPAAETVTLLGDSIRVCDGEQEIAIVGTLDLALTKAAACQQPVIQVFKDTVLRRTPTIDLSCTIECKPETAGDPKPVIRSTPGALTIGAGARVLLSDAIFVLESGARPTVKVAAGGQLALKGEVTLAQVETSDATGLELAGSIENPVNVRVPGNDIWEAFGVYTTTREIADACAPLFVNLDNDEVIGTAANGILTWDLKHVSDEDAVFTLEAGGTSMNFSSSRLLGRCLTDDATLVVRKTGGFGGAFDVTGSLTLVGADEGVAITNIVSTPASFTVAEGGSLVITNLTLSGFQGDKFIWVNDGRLTLEKDAVLTNVMLKARGKAVGTITVASGHMTMKPGAKILNCSTSGRYGGGIYAQSGEVNLEGGTISGCESAEAGGGVYAITRNGVTHVTVSGDMVVRDNTTDLRLHKPSDIEVSTVAKYPIEVVAPLTGYIGIKNSYETEPAACYSLSNLSAEEAEASAEALHSNLPPDDEGMVLKAYVDSENQLFRWKESPPYVAEGTEGAVARLVYPNGERQSYMTIGDAFEYMTGDCAVELLTNELVYAQNLTIPYDITLRSAPEAGEVCRLSRTNDWQVVVPAGRALTLTNICLNVAGEVSSKEPIIEVAGGALTLESGAVVSGMRKNVYYNTASRVSPGIFVYDGGTLTMKKGSLVEDCKNLFVDNVTSGRDSGRGGGITLYDGSTGLFLGGSVTNCQAAIGGGLALLKNSKAYVSGDFTVKANLSAITNTLSRVPYLGDDIVVAEGSTLTLTGPLTDEARLGFRTEYAADTNLVANVPDWAQSWESVEYLATNAAQCFRSDSKNIRGVVVTNATDALIVWDAALAEDGSYRPASGDTVYFAVPAAPNPDPLEPEPEEWATPLPIAFKSIAYANDIVTLVLTDAVQWCNYQLYATNTLEGGFVITNTAGEYIVAPVTNFQWKVTEPEIKLEIPSTDAQRFWRATATEGLIP